jgi:predicted protein tyrosine phosphatase
VLRYKPQKPAILISISDPDLAPPKFPVDVLGQYKDGLVIQFWDAEAEGDYPRSFPDPTRLALGKPVTREGLFSVKQGVEILDFVGKYRDVREIVIHCSAGMCRSPAVAAALQFLLDRQTSSYLFAPYRPNLLVYARIIEASCGG